MTVICTLPPPRTGQTAVSDAVLRHLRSLTTVRLYDWSGGGGTTGPRWRIRKAIRSIISAIYVLTLRWRRGEHLYTVANDGFGLWYNTAVAAAARVRGVPVVYHHHSFAYLHRHDSRLQRLIRWSPGAIHLVLGPEMQTAMKTQYPNVENVRIATNHFMVDRVASTELPGPNPRTFDNDNPLVIGHLSNLSVEKGIGRVLDTFTKLHDKGLPVQLRIAGPATSDSVAAMIHESVAKYDGDLTWHGPLYGDDKDQFFQSIDVFLFPTLYATEAQPLVLIEAMQRSVPVLSYRRACIGTLVGDAGGQLFDPVDDFPAVAAEWIARVIDDPKFYKDQSERTRLWAEQFGGMADQSLATVAGAVGMDRRLI